MRGAIEATNQGGSFRSVYEPAYASLVNVLLRPPNADNRANAATLTDVIRSLPLESSLWLPALKWLSLHAPGLLENMMPTLVNRATSNDNPMAALLRAVNPEKIYDDEPDPNNRLVTALTYNSSAKFIERANGMLKKQNKRLLDLTTPATQIS
jgi:hypothetical protein